MFRPLEKGGLYIPLGPLTHLQRKKKKPFVYYYPEQTRDYMKGKYFKALQLDLAWSMVKGGEAVDALGAAQALAE